MNIDKERLIAFTDAIIAIAATIMVLELVTPADTSLHGLLSQWPVFIAYVNSFVLIYIVWYNHHNAFDKINNLTTKVFLYNGLWLFVLTLVPFTTRWVGEHPYATLPEFLYAFILLVWSVLFQIMDNQILKDDNELTPDATNTLKVRLPLYAGLVVAMITSFISPIASLLIVLLIVISMTLAIFYTKV